MVRLRSLGTIDLRDAHGNELRAVLVQPRRFALLVALAVTRPYGFQRRDRLAALFWPEESAERARAALSRAIYFLRSHLGDDVVLSRGAEEISIDRARFSSDAEAFNAALDSGDPAAALDLYGGELLPAFFASGAPGFEEWLESEREHFRARAASAATILAAAAEAGDDLFAATRWARRAADLAPFDEVAVRRLLRGLDRSGDRAGAIRFFREFSRSLESQLGVSPAPETRALAETITARDTEALIAPVAPPSAPPERRRTHLPSSVARRRGGRMTLAAVGAALLILPWVTRQADVDPFRVDVALFAPTGRVPSRAFGDSIESRLFDALVQARLVRTTPDAAPRSGWRLSLPPDSLKGRTGRIAATEVSGSWSESQGMISIRARVTERRGKGREWDVVDAASIDSGLALIERVAERVAGAVAVLGSEYYASLLPGLGPPPRIEAWQEFMEGARFDATGRKRDAVQHYRVAVALDSTFRWPLAQAALAATTSDDPYGTWADSVLSEVHSARDGFAPLERNLAEYAFAIRATDWETSYRAIRAAAAIAPEQYSYQEAVRALNLGRPGDAVVALRRPALSRLAKSGSLNYWRLLSSSYHALGNHRRELDAIRAARAVNPANPGLRLQELKALSALGMIDQVAPRLDSLVGQPREEWITAGAAMVEVARELRAHGHEAVANQTLARAVAWFRQRPAAEAAMPSHQYFLGEALYLAGDLEPADSLFRILAQRYPDDMDYLGYLGAIAARRGDHSSVKRVVAMLRARKPVTPLPGETSVVWRAVIEALSGNKPEAMRLLVEAFGPNGTFNLHATQDFEGMRDYAPFREFIRAKG